MNSTNATYQPLSYWFGQFGFPYTLDSLVFYTITPLSLISLCLNIITFRILTKLSFLRSQFYSYMKFYILNSALLSLLLMTVVVSSTRNIYQFTNSYAACFYGLYIFMFLKTNFIMIGSGFEISLLIERSFYFSPNFFKSIKVLTKSKKFIFIFFIFTCLISIVFVFAAEPNYLDVELDEKTWYRIWYYGVTSFSLTLTGNALIIFAYLFRDILPLIIKLTLNAYIVNSLKKYTRKLKMRKLEIASKISYSLDNDQIQINLNKNNGTHYNYVSKADRNQTYTAVIMSFFSLLEHSFYSLGYVLYFFHHFELYTFFIYAAFLSILFKLIGNIFILYIFNSLFRNEVRKYFKFLTSAI